MSWNLIESFQNDTDLRLILPFGLSLNLGDMVSVGKDGGFKLEGNCQSLLRLSSGKAREGKVVDLVKQSGNDASRAVRVKRKGSTLFEKLSSASAGFDISFGSKYGWVLAVTGRTFASLTNLDRFRRPILDAYRWTVLKPDWALVTGLSTVQRMTLLASRNGNTKDGGIQQTPAAM